MEQLEQKAEFARRQRKESSELYVVAPSAKLQVKLKEVAHHQKSDGDLVHRSKDMKSQQDCAIPAPLG